MGKMIAKPKPKAPTDEEMQAYVSGGTGKDTETQKTVKTENMKSVEMARLTVDLSKDDHRRFKIACTMAGVKMNEEIRQFIERRTAELEGRAAGL